MGKSRVVVSTFLGENKDENLLKSKPDFVDRKPQEVTRN